MALPAPVIKKVFVVGDRKEVVFDLTFDSSYRNAGAGDHGEPFVGPDLGMEIVLTHIHDGSLVKSDGTSSFRVTYNATTGQLQVWKSNGTTDFIPVASGVDLSGYTARLVGIGKGSVSSA